MATKAGMTDVVKLLLDAGADIDAKDKVNGQFKIKSNTNSN